MNEAMLAAMTAQLSLHRNRLQEIVDQKLDHPQIRADVITLSTMMTLENYTQDPALKAVFSDMVTLLSNISTQ